jgi:uncharacterized membrane protein YqjE
VSDPTLGQALQTRLNLATLEFELERTRLQRSVWLVIALVVCSTFALLALQALLVMLLWDRAGPWTLGALTLAWGVTALWSGLHWRRLRASHATPFSQTAAVLRDDAIGLSALWTGRQRTGQQP